MKEQPAEYYFVDFEGERIATLRDLTCSERDFLIAKYLKTDSYHVYEIARLCKMLGADKKIGEEGWEFKEKPSIDVLEKMSLNDPDLFYTLLFHANRANDQYQANKEGIVKNLKEQFSST
jgi:hypothetical protein